MKEAVDYLNRVKAIILGSSHVDHIEIGREETLDEIGFYRFRLKLIDGSLLEMFERISVQRDSVQVLKYSFHWQNADGQLRKRWDNAAHHPEISTHPYHIHAGSDENVLSGELMNAEKVLLCIAEEISNRDDKS